jgi:hypothetical protein
MTAPLVSVLVPAWNAGRSITRALHSVLADGTAPLQVVVVDDGSTDDTTAVVESIAVRDPRVELVRSPANGGPSAARNLGLPRLRGEWVTFLDADDRLLPGAIAALLGAATRTDAVAVVGQRIWSDGTRTWISRAYDQPDIRVPGRKSLLANPGLMFYASGTGKLFHRSIVDGLAFDGRVLGDQPWTIRALLRAGDRIEVIEDDVYEWSRPAPGSSDSSITSRKHDSAALAAEAVLVAIGAWQAVHDEAVRVLPDPADQERIGSAYVERLMRSDFAGPVDRALKAGDPGMDRLFEALLAFVRAVPQATLASAPSCALIVRPPLRRWNRMTPGARRTYDDLLRALPPAVVPSKPFLALPDVARSSWIAVASLAARSRRAARRRLTRSA